MRTEIIATLAMLCAGAAPIALNSGGSPEAYTGTELSTAVLNGATGCAAYSFSSEPTLGWGRRSADRLCFGTSTGDANVDFYNDGTSVQTIFNVAPNLALPHVANLDDPDSGVVISDATTPFTWVDEGVAKMTLGVQGTRTYWCFGPWNSATTPCFTSDANDLVMKYSDGSAFTGNLDLGAGHYRLKNGTAAAPSIVWNNDNTGFYRSAADKFSVSINGTFAGHLSEYDTTAMGLEPASGYYIKVDNVSDPAAAAVTGDCDAVGESGRIIFDHTNHKLMVCNDVSSTRAGWDTLPALTF